MPRVRLRYVHEYRDVTGKIRRYFRRPGYARVPLPGLVGSAEFRAAYEEALKLPKAKPIGSDLTTKGSVGEAVALYLGSVDHNKHAEETKRTRRNVLERLRKKHGDKPLKGISQQVVQKMTDELADRPAAARNFLHTMRALVKFCLKQNLLKADPTTGVERVKIKTKGYRTWDEEEIEKFEAFHPVGTKARLAFALALYTAQRRSDIVRMSQNDVRNGHIRVSQHKTGTMLEIPLHPELARIIQETKTVGRKTYLVTQYGESFSVAGITNWFRDRCNEAGLPVGLSLHGLRKAACRRLAEAGCTEQQIMSISGHRNSREVQIYVEAANKKRMATDAMAKIQREFPGGKN